MTDRLLPVATVIFAAFGLASLTGGFSDSPILIAAASGQPVERALPQGGFEVWIADQSDTRPGYFPSWPAGT